MQCGFYLSFNVYIILYISPANAFNIDVNSVIITSGSPESQFGFSLLGHSTDINQKGILVGAPKKDSDGAIFFCDYTTLTQGARQCRQIDLNIIKASRSIQGIGDSLFGYSMSSVNGSYPQPVTVCAPRLSTTHVTRFYITGGCFELDAALQSLTVHAASVSACTDIRDGLYSIDLRHCTMGASVGHYEKAPLDVFMGGPYFHFGKGMGMILNTKYYTPTVTSKDDKASNSLMGTSLDISNRLYVVPELPSSKPVYVAYGGPGVPVDDRDLGKAGPGLVAFYRKDHVDQLGEMKPVSRVNGQQFGSHFGSSLLLLDLNADGWDDLIVGAPNHKLEASVGSDPEYGAVFVFQNRQKEFGGTVTDDSNVDIFSYDSYQLITPPDKSEKCNISSLSGFGETLAKIGDINQDGYEDFAIGAPYGVSGGVVFIYHGTSGEVGPPTQIICAAVLSQNQLLKGFGFSIGLKGLDLDGNGYPDMAIGAPISDSVVILRARPVIRFEAHLTNIDGSDQIPGETSELIDCTSQTRSVSGHRSNRVWCTDVKLWINFKAVGGKQTKCDASAFPTTLDVSLLLKAYPNQIWLEESESNRTQPVKRDANQCPIENADSENHLGLIFFSQVAFVGEQRTSMSDTEPFFTANSSVLPSAIDGPGGHFILPIKARCKNADDKTGQGNANDLAAATTVRLIFPDFSLVDKTSPIKFGIKWKADLPVPPVGTTDIDRYPSYDPRQNTQSLQLSFKSLCTDASCCTKLRVEYNIQITRDKDGPVVYIGDDNTQTIEIVATVTNIGSNPAYAVNLLSTYPASLLDLDGKNDRVQYFHPDSAICSLGNPIPPGTAANCRIKFLVFAHQLALKMDYFSVNSTILMSNKATVVDGEAEHKLLVNVKMLVNVAVSGSVEPNTAYFLGTVNDGITSITTENQIGRTRLLLRFTVQNLRRHSLVPASRLIIDWPYEIAGDINEPHGKYMLYLLQNPHIVHHRLSVPGQQVSEPTPVVCDSIALSKLVNPNGYRIFNFLRTSSKGVEVKMAPVPLPQKHPESYPPLVAEKKLIPIPLNSTSSKSSKTQLMTNISCYNGQLRCVPITCDLGKLSYKNGPITFELYARLWDNTMKEDFNKVFLTNLHITATWRADVYYRIDLGDSDFARGTIDLQLLNSLEQKVIVPKYMILYITLAVFFGLLLLALLILILYKCGFFERKRYREMIARMKKRDSPENQSAGENAQSGNTRKTNLTDKEMEMERLYKPERSHLLSGTTQKDNYNQPHSDDIEIRQSNYSSDRNRRNDNDYVNQQIYGNNPISSFCR